MGILSESFNDLPIAVPACGGNVGVLPMALCWFGPEARCRLAPVNDLGLCEIHLREMRAETTA